MTGRRKATAEHRAIPSAESELLARLTSGLAYAMQCQGTAVPSLEWQIGTVGRHGDLLPIRDLLEGVCDPKQADKIARHLARLRAGNPSEIWLRYETPDGPCHVHDSAAAEFDHCGAVVRIAGVVRDVTAERASGEVAREVWRRLILDHVDLGLACWDADQRFVLANGLFAQLICVPAPRLDEGITLADFLRACARSHEIVIDGSIDDWVDRTLGDSARQRSAEWHLADGRSLDVAWCAMAGGTLLRLQDTTVARSGERALRQAKQIAEEANSKKSRFLRAANHDLRQPLATLKILIFSGFESRTDAERRDLLRSMDVAVSVMEEILGSLLQVGQLDANRITTQKHHFQASQMFDRLRMEFAPLAAQKGLELRVIGSFVTLETDRALLERILGNFIANAIRFTQTGGILVGLRRRGTVVDIQVWDTGCGIAHDQLGLIFEEFHQIDPKSSERQRGLGLGLNIAQRLAELLGHELRVTSRVGRGSMFSVRVPIGNIWLSRIGDLEVTEKIAGEFFAVSVLVIEDDENLRSAVEGMLRRWGVEVLAVRSGHDAMAALEPGSYRPDLVLVDYSLPNGDAGTDVLTRVRARLGSDVPGIVCTADTDAALLRRIRESGTPILVKPISPPQLRSVMHHLLYERGDRDEVATEGGSHG